MNEQKYYLVNERTKQYKPIGEIDWNCNWKEKFAHTKGEDYIDICAYRIWDHNKINGIPYVYDLCRDGGLFTLLVDSKKFTEADIEKACNCLRFKNDVLQLTINKIEEV